MYVTLRVSLPFFKLDLVILLVGCRSIENKPSTGKARVRATNNDYILYLLFANGFHDLLIFIDL